MGFSIFDTDVLGGLAVLKSLLVFSCPVKFEAARAGYYFAIDVMVDELNTGYFETCFSFRVLGITDFVKLFYL